MKIIFGILFLGSLGSTIYFKYKLNKAYDRICYLDKGNPLNQRNRTLLLKLRDLADEYNHGKNIFSVMREISETIKKIELDTRKSN